MRKIATLLLFFIFQHSIHASEQDAILGFWFADAGKSKIEIYKCEQKYCGRIAWLEEPNYPADDEKGMAGKVKIDRENPDKTLNTRLIVGLNLVKGFIFDRSIEYDEEDRDAPMWVGGTVYDPRNGKTYSSTMTLISAKELEVRGYVLIPLFGRTVTWKR